jgi:hypothetical protein
MVVMARKSGKKWYIGGINGEDKAKKLTLDLTKFGAKTANLITDGNENLSFMQSKIELKDNTELSLKPFGGFIIVIE